MSVTCEDCNFGELSDDVDDDVQSAASPAANHEDEDRLEQDNRVQNRHGTELEGRGRMMLGLAVAAVISLFPKV